MARMRLEGSFGYEQLAFDLRAVHSLCIEAKDFVLPRAELMFRGKVDVYKRQTFLNGKSVVIL